jgi:hypothetical protein
MTRIDPWRPDTGPAVSDAGDEHAVSRRAVLAGGGKLAALTALLGHIGWTPDGAMAQDATPGAENPAGPAAQADSSGERRRAAR